MKFSFAAVAAAFVLAAVPADAEMREMTIVGKIERHRSLVFPQTLPPGVSVGQDYNVKLRYDTGTFSNLTFGTSPYQFQNLPAADVRVDFLGAVLTIGSFTWNIGGTNSTGHDRIIFQYDGANGQFIDLNVGARPGWTGSTAPADFAHIRISSNNGGLFDSTSNIFTTNAPPAAISPGYFSFKHGDWDVLGKVTELSWPRVAQVVPPVTPVVPVAGAVPEPASWMMMIAGFGLIGGVMRRRQTTIAYA